MKKYIVVIGNYGTDNKLNGQTARTRTVTESIQEKYEDKYKIVKIDTKKTSVFLILKTLFFMLVAKRIVIMPAQRSLKPILKMINCFHCKKRVVYVAIGGWIYDFIKDEQKTINVLKGLKCILVQIESLKTKLSSIGLENVVTFPNYRKLTNAKIVDKKDNNRLVFYSRVREDKGIKIAIQAVSQLNEKVQLDIYGPIDEDFKDEFFNLIENKKNINYRGVLNGDSIITTLSMYNFMIFPTFYDGEGFPGAVLESIMAGTPVIASDWKYNKEIIKNGINGIILEENNTKCLTETLNNILKEKELQQKLVLNCLETSKEYEEKNIVPILYKAINLQ